MRARLEGRADGHARDGAAAAVEVEAPVEPGGGKRGSGGGGGGGGGFSTRLLPRRSPWPAVSGPPGRRGRRGKAGRWQTAAGLGRRPPAMHPAVGGPVRIYSAPLRQPVEAGRRRRRRAAARSRVVEAGNHLADQGLALGDRPPAHTHVTFGCYKKSAKYPAVIAGSNIRQ